MTLPLSLPLRQLQIPSPAGPANVVTATSFQHQQQKETFWCWAAVTAAIDDYYHSGFRRQCDLVDLTYPGNQCCNNGGSSQCNQAAHTSAALASQGHLAQTMPGSLSPAGVDNEIAQKKPPHPIACSLSSGGGGHAVTIIGRDTVNGRLRLQVSNPTYPAPLTYDYQRFQARWTRTHLTS